MTYQLRDRPDGQVEIIIHRPVLVGVFPERATAERVCLLLQAEEPELPEDAPAGFATASSDVAEAQSTSIEALADELVETRITTRSPAMRRRTKSQLPAVIEEKPRPPAFYARRIPEGLTEVQIDAAFGRIAAGEEIAVLARELVLSQAQLRGMWSQYRRHMQAHIAQGGPQPCSMCATPFVPSISQPDTCARCSRD